MRRHRGAPAPLAACSSAVTTQAPAPWFPPPLLLQDELGRTALHYAASLGHVDCINAMLSRYQGPQATWDIPMPNTRDTRLVDVRNNNGFTPLHYAVWADCKPAIQVGVCRAPLPLAARPEHGVVVGCAGATQFTRAMSDAAPLQALASYEAAVNVQNLHAHFDWIMVTEG